MNKKTLSFEEFYKSCYHTQYYFHIPLVDRMKIDKREHFVKGQYSEESVKQELYRIYEKNLHKLKI